MSDGAGGSSGRTEEFPDVCVISIRARETTQTATYELMEIIGQITGVSLVTVLLSDESPIFEEFEVVELAERGTGRTLGSAIVRFAKNQFRMCRELLRRDEEIVLFYGATAYLLPVLFARLVGRTVVLEPRGDVPLTLKLRWAEDVPEPLAAGAAKAVWLLERLSYHAASAIIAYTPAMASELGLDAFGEKLYTSGARHVDVDRFSPETPYDEREPMVGFVGRLEVEKRIPELVEIAKALAPEVRFLFVGEGSCREAVEARLSDEIDRGEVEVLEWVPHDEVPDQLNRLKLLVLPSQPTEGLPTTILEAFACGTPVYATPVSGVPDVVREGETGFLMTETDPSALATGIERILDRQDLGRISQRARALVVEEYSFQASVDRYREMLAAIVES
jgi:glycosyltransferase involved in cell wall biosynthesis